MIINRRQKFQKEEGQELTNTLGLTCVLQLDLHVFLVTIAIAALMVVLEVHHEEIHRIQLEKFDSYN